MSRRRGQPLQTTPEYFDNDETQTDHEPALKL